MIKRTRSVTEMRMVTASAYDILNKVTVIWNGTAKAQDDVVDGNGPY